MTLDQPLFEDIFIRFNTRDGTAGATGAPRADQRVVYRDERVRQPSWSRRFAAPSFLDGATEHAYPLEVLAEVLSGGSTTRLYRSLVVEQGIVVNAGMDRNYFDKEVVHLAMRPEQK